jgi:phage terminase large subunit-like protein
VSRWNPQWFRRLSTELAQLPRYPPDERRAIRRALARDPVAFAMIYMRKGLRLDDETERVTFSEVHFEWARLALTWRTRNRGPQENRHAFIAPRSMGKTTWWFLILPLWAAANGHVRFAAAFAHSTSQAETHLSTFKHELDTNILLRADYPELCTPARRPTGTTVADRAGMLHAKSGFVFAGKGIDSQSLGMKVGHQRPDLLIFDDIEPDEAKYSGDLAEKRLGTVLDAILPLNIRANVVMVGTVTMPGSVMHQLVKSRDRDVVGGWVAAERIQVHHHLPILTNDDGTSRSVWPEKWPLAWLIERRDSPNPETRREYAKNYLNDPMAREGAYWTADDFKYGTLDGVTRVALFVDPAVTAHKTSDFTGLAVVGWAPTGHCVVYYAAGVRLTGSALRAHIARLLVQFDRIKRVVVEVNQGGDLWRDILHNLPTGPPEQTHSKESKEIRFAQALAIYQRGRVLHAQRFATLEEQAVAFPKAAHDDVIDAVCAGVLYFLGPPTTIRATVRTITPTAA